MRSENSSAASSRASTSREVSVLTLRVKGTPGGGESSRALRKKRAQPKMAKKRLRFRSSTLRMARAATVMARLVISLWISNVMGFSLLSRSAGGGLSFILPCRG